MTYKVLIIDDEPAVRERLKSMVDWMSLGFELAGEAADGEDGESLIRQLAPNVVFTDIRMPVIDGLTLIARCKMDKRLHFVILSGYSDFDYAQTAMKYGVRHYLLKPITEPELRKVLFELEQELADQGEHESMLQGGIAALRDQAWRELLLSSYTKEKGARAERFGLDAGSIRRILLAEIEPNHGVVEISLEAGNQIVQLLRDVLGCPFIPDEEKLRYAGFILENSTLLGDNADWVVEQLNSKLKARFGLRAVLALGYSVAAKEEIQASYNGAKALLDAKLQLEGQALLRYERLQGVKLHSWSGVSSWNVDELLKAVETQTFAEISAAVQTLFSEVAERKIPLKLLEGMLMEALLQLARLVTRYGGELDDVLGNHFSLRQQLREQQSMMELQLWFERLGMRIAEYLGQIRRNKPRKITRDVIDYIETYYRDNLTLKILADKVFLNPVYLGQLFKQDTGVTFNDFLTETRLKASIRLLVDTDLPVYEIAELVGYRAVGTYHKAFRKIEGVSPADYRMRRRGY
ncbi:response regulator transcription factor [Gorillibacterium massiliense]|uniref:response regulator transcription factor n=1 Tax=Gorillibacterium massiliense TaxID=1280390 RepID=UPI0004BCE11B|nr:response regulator [Gorillibacterium massiliense]